MAAFNGRRLDELDAKARAHPPGRACSGVTCRTTSQVTASGPGPAAASPGLARTAGAAPPWVAGTPRLGQVGAREGQGLRPRSAAPAPGGPAARATTEVLGGATGGATGGRLSRPPGRRRPGTARGGHGGGGRGAPTGPRAAAGRTARSAPTRCAARAYWGSDPPVTWRARAGSPPRRARTRPGGPSAAAAAATSGAPRAAAVVPSSVKGSRPVSELVGDHAQRVEVRAAIQPPAPATARGPCTRASRR